MKQAIAELYTTVTVIFMHYVTDISRNLICLCYTW